MTITLTVKQAKQSCDYLQTYLARLAQLDLTNEEQDSFIVNKIKPLSDSLKTIDDSKELSEQLDQEYSQLKHDLHELLENIAIKRSKQLREKIKRADLFKMITNRRRINPELDKSDEEELINSFKELLKAQILFELAQPVRLQTKESSPLKTVSLPNLFDDIESIELKDDVIPDPIERMKSSPTQMTLLFPMSASFNKEKLDELTLEESSAETLMQTAFHAILISGRSFKGARLGTEKAVIHGSQREFVDKWTVFVSELLKSTAERSEEQNALIKEWEKLQGSGFLEQGLCNGFALMAIIESMNYEILLERDPKVIISTKDLLECALVPTPENLKKLLLCIRLTALLMEPNDILKRLSKGEDYDSKNILRQHEFTAALQGLIEKGLVAPKPETQLYEVHAGGAIKLDNFIRLLKEITSPFSLRIGTAEHAITIRNDGSDKFTLIDPNQNLLEQMSKTLTAQECTEKLFETISPGAKFLWERNPMSLSISLYATHELSSAADLHDSYFSDRSMEPDSESRMILNRGATGLMMAVTVSDSYGVKRYANGAEAPYLKSRYDHGADLPELREDSLERAIKLRDPENVKIILDAFEACDIKNFASSIGNDFSLKKFKVAIKPNIYHLALSQKDPVTLSALLSYRKGKNEVALEINKVHILLHSLEVGNQENIKIILDNFTFPESVSYQTTDGHKVSTTVSALLVENGYVNVEQEELIKELTRQNSHGSSPSSFFYKKTVKTLEEPKKMKGELNDDPAPPSPFSDV